MKKYAGRRPSAGTVLGTVALVFAVSGVAVALPGTNSVNSGDIKNRSVKPRDLAKPKVRNLTLINDWGPDASPCVTPRVVREVTKTVRLEGCIDQAGIGPSHAFTLPTGFRPAGRTFLTVDVDGTNHGRLVINTNGEVDVFDGGSNDSKGFTSLDGVTFRAR